MTFLAGLVLGILVMAATAVLMGVVMNHDENVDD